MVVGQRDVHHRANDDGALVRDRPLLDGVHSQNAALGRINDRRREQGSVDTAVADGESTALKLLEFEFVFLRAPNEVSNSELDLSKAHFVGVAQNRYHQALAAADGNADIVVVSV